MIKFKKILQKKISRKMEEGDINYKEFLQKQKAGAIIIDVRSRQEYEEGHINGAMLIPLFELNSVTNNKLDKTKEIVIYCQSGIRGRKGYDILKRKGYKAVYNLYSGLDGVAK